jgi:hypothetical protein
VNKSLFVVLDSETDVCECMVRLDSFLETDWEGQPAGVNGDFISGQYQKNFPPPLGKYCFFLPALLSAMKYDLLNILVHQTTLERSFLNMINPLNHSGTYMNHLLQHPVNLHFMFVPLV